jgi:PAS domain S-box-containing protein
MSRRFLEICGLDAEEARSDPLKAFACVHPDDYDEWGRKNAEAFANKMPFREECRVVAGGEVRWIFAESQPRPLADGSTVWEGVLTDITQQKEVEAALAAALAQELLREEAHRQELEQKLKTSLTAAAVAHEITQPLSRIRLETQLTLSRHQAEPLTAEQTTGYLEDILVESQQLVDTIEQMKSLLRIVRAEHADVVLATVLQSALLYMRPSIEEYAVELHASGLDDPFVIPGDDVQLQTALLNLLRNAVEAVAEQPATRRIVAVSLAVHADRTEVIVADSGPGMPADAFASALFATSKRQGMGIGLYLVQTCAENHGGSVESRRSAWGGAEVRLILPRSRQPSTV